MEQNESSKANNTKPVKIASFLYDHIVVMKEEEERKINVVANRLIRKGMAAEGIDVSKLIPTK